ncbi:hypothetical protein GJ744_002352 [Endocarpon pusillum]|uniref:Uncharacterized protein n=1 Tax=Endocarpon pusillum TaxID=364733 RepID=A0A8H7AMY8_9EURO|nr:hypothetical protein GJ744_002352 [Endocarpon pusillum]
MSDPFSVVIAVLAVASITQRIGHLAGRIHQVDKAKLDQIYYRLIAEIAKTKGWVNQIRNWNGEDFLSSIDPAELEEVSLLLRKLEDYHEHAKLKYQGAEAARNKGIMPPETMKAKLRLFNGAFDDLKVMADTLAAMNEALRSMVPLPPAYDGGPAASNPSSEAIQASQISAVAEIGSDEIQSQSFLAAPSEEAAEPTVKCLQQVSTSVETVWRLALEGLMKIAMAKTEKLIGNCAGRLKLWGVGLFETGYSLDDILVSRSLKDSPFYQILIRTLANILLFEEHEIKCITANRTASSQRRLLQVKSEITALLGTDELVVLAIEDWSSQLCRNHDNTEAGQLAETRVHTQNHTKRMDISIARAVENLFDLLPGIRAERHAYCHDKESNRESWLNLNES